MTFSLTLEDVFSLAELNKNDFSLIGFQRLSNTVIPFIVFRKFTNVSTGCFRLESTSENSNSERFFVEFESQKENICDGNTVSVDDVKNETKNPSSLTLLILAQYKGSSSNMRLSTMANQPRILWLMASKVFKQSSRLHWKRTSSMTTLHEEYSTRRYSLV